MLRTRTIAVPATTRETVEAIVCDICGAEGRGGSWAGSYEVMDVEIRMKEGSAYPEGGQGEEHVADLCPDCFRDKLVPWLTSQGVKMRTKEWDF